MLGEVRERYEFSLVGFVAMPEHVHLLMSEPAVGTPSTVMQVLKQRTSRLAHRGNGSADVPLWFPRFHDFNVWSEKKKNEKLNYMHMNPVERGLVSHPKNWPWSSYGFYATGEQGLIRIDRV
ncbi:MAG: transposase [Candidatus Acidiferrales bacterium]